MSTNSNDLTPNTGKFDLTQTTFLFNWVANAAAAHSGPPTELAKIVEGKLNHLLTTYGTSMIGGDWQVVFQPGVSEVFDHSMGQADNTAFVVYSSKEDLYIVAIAGTNPTSPLDWVIEDFEIEMLNWSRFSGHKTFDEPKTKDTADKSTPQISMGTGKGIWSLTSQLTQSNGFDPNKQLGQFLTNLTSSKTGTRVIFTGHSLGGALSPTMANWFRSVKSDTISHSYVYAMPTAGPTPGNEAYQTQWDSAQYFPQIPVAHNNGNKVMYLNCDVRCVEDVVPHAWQEIYSGNPFNTNHYFIQRYKANVKNVTDGLLTPMAELNPAGFFQTAAPAIQYEALYQMFLRQGANPIDFRTDFPVYYMSGSKVKEINGPFQNPIDVNKLDQFKAYGAALGIIHCWAYGTAAFNIDFSVFQKIGMELSATAEPATANA